MAVPLLGGSYMKVPAMPAQPRLWIALYLLCCLPSLGALSCAPSEKRAIPEGAKKVSSECPTQVPRTVLSKEEIIGIANDAACRHDCDTDEQSTIVFYDEGNARWERHVRMAKKMAALDGDEVALEGSVERSRRLEDRDFQVVLYMPRRGLVGEDLWVVVDRSTGEVLRVTAWP